MPANNQRYNFRVPSPTPFLTEKEKIDRLTQDLNTTLLTIRSAFQNLIGAEGIIPPFEADINLNGHKVVNAAEPTAKKDYTTKNYVDSQLEILQNIINQILEIIHNELPPSLGQRDLYLSRLLPTGANDTIAIGYFQLTNDAHSLDLAITIADSANTSLAKRFLLETNRSFNTTWETALPLVDTGVSANSDDFDLEARQDNAASQLHLRLRRTAGTSTAATALVHMHQRGSLAEVFLESSTGSASVTATTAFVQNTLLTQKDTFLGIQNQTPIFSLHASVHTSGATFFSQDSYGSNSGLVGRRANGTRAAPTAIAVNDVLLHISGRGATGATFTGPRSQIQFVAEEAYTATNQGTGITFSATPPASITLAEKARLTGEGNWLLGTTAFGSGATQSLVIANGTVPGSDVANQHSYYGTTTSTNITSVPTWRSADGLTLRMFQQAALTAADNTAINAVYDATEQGVLNNVRDRVNEIETRMKVLGMLP